MNLKQLLAALDAAKNALKSKPEDEALKAAVQAAQTAYDEALAASREEEEEETEEEEESEEDGDKKPLTPEESAKLIKKLRAENAKHRTGKKAVQERLAKLEKGLRSTLGDEEDELDPEKLAGSLQQTQFHNALLSAAMELGIAKSDFDYFSFLVQRKTGELKEGEELTDEDLEELATQARGKSGGGGKGGDGRTSIGSGDKKTPKPGDTGNTTVEQFVKMSVTEKSELYTKKPELYNRLFTEAKDKSLLRR